ncbi:MAG: hypothetical protein Q4F83_01885 [Eubacteriales bacterium]|nr:hypothetical protein [Eubacteriales bacterium]
MERFGRSDGVIHFLFANEDEYYLDSLVRLSLDQYLYYCLKKEGYGNIFYIEESPKGFFVRMEDAKSVEEYPSLIKKDILGFFGIHYTKNGVHVTERIQNGRKSYHVLHKKKEELLMRLLFMMEERQEQNVFIISVRTFYRLFEGAEPEYRQRLKSVLETAQCKSILVLVGSLRADESLGCLTDREGIFHSELFPELRRLFQEGKVLVYEELKLELEKRYHVWDALNRENIQRMLCHMAFIERKGLALAEVEDYADFLYVWYHCDAFAAEWKGFLPEGENCRLSEVRSYLEKSRNREPLGRKIAALKGEEGENLSLLRLLKGIYYIQEERQPGLKKNAAAVRLQRYFSGQQEGTSIQSDRIRRKAELIVRESQKPWSDTSVDNQQEIEEGLELLAGLSPERDEDLEAIEKILNLVEYRICSREKLQREVYEKKIQWYRNIAQAAVEMNRMERRIHDWEERRRDCQKRFEQKMQAVRRNEEENPGYRQELEELASGKKHGGVSGELLLLDADRSEAVHLYRQQNYLAQLIGKKRQTLLHLREGMREIELFIDEYGERKLQKFHEALGQASDSMKRNLELEAEFARRLQEVKSENLSALENAAEQNLNAGAEREMDLEFIQIMENERKNLCN